MKKALLLISAMCLGVLPTYAIDAPTDIQVVGTSDSSIALEWSPVDESEGYYVHYGLEAANGGDYSTVGIDLITEEEYVLEDLEAETKYFIAVTAVDKFLTESAYSEEIEYSTSTQGVEEIVTAFRIKEVIVIDKTSIELQFSKNVKDSSDAQREFLLQEVDTGIEIPIEIDGVDEENPSNVIAILAGELTENTEYKLTVLDIQDEDGGAISFGIDAFTVFVAPGDMTTIFSPEPETDLNSAGESETIEVVLEDDNQVEEQTEPEMVAGDNAGTTLTSEDLAANTLTTAEANEKLPKAGAEHWLLLAFALLCTAGIYTVSFKKQS